MLFHFKKRHFLENSPAIKTIPVTETEIKGIIQSLEEKQLIRL
jgi:hypothetical protein